MTLQGRANPLRNQDNAANNTDTVPKPLVTQWAVPPPSSARPSFQDKLGMLSPQLQHEPAKSRESLLQQPAKDKTAPHLIPRLRAMVKSQAFKNILVDEMDMMLSRAATLIQANWRGYRLRQKLVSQMLAAKAIQEAWRRFNTRRILRSSKAVVKKTDAEEGDIPYHRPQQVRFQYPEENRLLCQPLTLNKETQFPSSDRLAHLQPCAAQGTPEAGMQAPHAAGTPGATFLPHQTVTMKLSCPVSLDTKRQPCLVTRTFRNACLSHAEGDTVKTSHVTAGTNKTGAPEPPVAGRYGQEVSRSFKTQAQTQAHVEAEILKAPSQMYPVVSITNTPPQMYLVSTMTNTSAQTCPVPTMTKTPPRMCPVVSVAKTPAQTYPVPTMTKTPPQTCPVSTIIKTPAQTCQVPVMTKTPARVRPTASITSNPSQTRPAAVTAKILPQVCLLASMIKPPSKTRPVVAMTKTTPQMCVVPAMVKTTPQMRPAATTTKSPLQKCLGATMAKTSSQTCPVTSMTKPPPQARLAAMITKTPAQIRSVAAVLRTLCSATPEAANLKSPPQAAVAAGTSNTLSHMHLNVPKAKATVNTKQAVGTVKVSSHSYLSEANVKWLPQPRLVSGAPKAPAKPPLDAEKIKACLQKQVKAETIPKTNVAAGMLRPSTWIKAAEERNKPPSQAHVYMPMETAVVLPQAQLAVPLTKATSQARPPAQQTSTLSQAQLGTCLTKASSQAHAPAQQTSLTKAPSLAHLVTCLTKAQSQAQLVAGAMKVPSRVHLPTGLVKTQSQAQLVTDKAKGLCTAHQSVELSSKTHSQPLLTGSEASTHACLHIGAKLDNRPTQLHPHSHGQDKATQGLRPVAPESQGMLVPLSAPTGHPTCNDSWGDSGTTRAQPSMPSQVAPCQDDATAFQLASLCAELAMVLGSQEDLRALLAKALSQTEVRAALNQALSKEILGTTVAKALPQGILGMVLVKALSWGELGITLSRALSRGELQAELTKAMQGRLAEVLSKALTDEERAALSQALCQGELGAVLSQSLSQAALRTAAKLPKADSKTAGSRMTMVPAPVEVDHRGSPLAACRPVKPQPSKGPKDAGMAGGQSWNSAVHSVMVRPMDHAAVAPCSARRPARGAGPWDAVGSKVSADPRQPGKLTMSVQTVEEIIVQAVITLQACMRGYLVRRTIKVWHQWATIIQATWRGYCVRRKLTHLYRATTVIQAAWRGYCTRRDRAQQMLLPGTWAELGSSRARTTSEHRCYQSCQPHVCSLCQSLSTGLGSPPSVVMLVGSSPRTCHMCGHTLPTRVVQGVGQGGGPWACVSQLASQSSQQLRHQIKAATVIQSAWRGFKIRRQLKQQQVAAKMVQATWRGHHTRTCLTTDALLGPASPWNSSRHTYWPGV
ncbi:LOW QUALITY PROTEIN: IQ domain-containing protein N [Cynocephalus volans]|uniref:LOW QUALITY PROTEIN: IQ domain-containing protein N n=1 Tax=Cynocephalus volans TaxID=110931 RepID=UPI002FC877A9